MGGYLAGPVGGDTVFPQSMLVDYVRVYQGPDTAERFQSSFHDDFPGWREVMLPYTLPYTMTGVRQAIGRGIVGVVAAEFFLSATGLGQVIMLASQNFDTAAVFAMILVIGLLGVGLTRIGQSIENRFARWRNY